MTNAMKAVADIDKDIHKFEPPHETPNSISRLSWGSCAVGEPWDSAALQMGLRNKNVTNLSPRA